MRAIVTCGPSYEPIDEVRRVTNFSTGELGTMLAATLAAAGWKTLCFRGIAATWPERPAGAEVRDFTTNDDLAGQLRALTTDDANLAIFHTAALADFRIATVRDGAGQPLAGAKLSSQLDRLTIELEPATKLLPQFRDWFPRARIVGWKYELEGSREDALAAGRRQVARCRSDACIVNGRAYGPGFGMLRPDGDFTHFESKAALCAALAIS